MRVSVEEVAGREEEAAREGRRRRQRPGRRRSCAPTSIPLLDSPPRRIHRRGHRWEKGTGTGRRCRQMEGRQGEAASTEAGGEGIDGSGTGGEGQHKDRYFAKCVLETAFFVCLCARGKWRMPLPFCHSLDVDLDCILKSDYLSKKNRLYSSVVLVKFSQFRVAFIRGHGLDGLKPVSCFIVFGTVDSTEPFYRHRTRGLTWK
jgi:hypothetical protein